MASSSLSQNHIMLGNGSFGLRTLINNQAQMFHNLNSKFLRTSGTNQ